MTYLIRIGRVGESGTVAGAVQSFTAATVIDAIDLARLKLTAPRGPALILNVEIFDRDGRLILSYTSRPSPKISS